MQEKVHMRKPVGSMGPAHLIIPRRGIFYRAGFSAKPGLPAKREHPRLNRIFMVLGAGTWTACPMLHESALQSVRLSRSSKRQDLLCRRFSTGFSARLVLLGVIPDQCACKLMMLFIAPKPQAAT